MDKNTIKEIRDRLGMTRADLARRLNVSEFTVWRWETTGPPTRGMTLVYLKWMAEKAQVQK